MSLYGSSSVTPRPYSVQQSTRLGAQSIQKSASDQTHQRKDSSFSLHSLPGVGIEEDLEVLTQFPQFVSQNEGYKANFLSACQDVQSTCQSMQSTVSEFSKWVYTVFTKRESPAEQHLVDISNKYKQVQCFSIRTFLKSFLTHHTLSK